VQPGSDQDVPKDWDGARMALQIGATVTAEWSGVPEEWSGETEWSHLTFVRSPPPVIATPPGFDLTTFTVLNLRTALLNQENALRFAPDRVYVLSGAVGAPSEMMSLNLAGALANAIDVANTVE
jgi:hypothetical protein